MFVLVFLGLYACSSSKKVSNIDSILYEDRIGELTPNFLVYHTSDSTSDLYFELFSEQLLYVRENISQPFSANVEIHYELFADGNTKAILDSATNRLVDNKISKDNKTIVGKIPMVLSSNANYRLKVIVKDINKRIATGKEIEINKTNKEHAQFFLVEKGKEDVCFDLNFSKANRLTIHSNLNPSFTLTMDYYITDSVIAKPPFSENNTFTFPNQPDSSISVNANNGMAEIETFYPGNYVFKINKEPSFSSRFFSGEFPEVTQYETMLYPIRYICTNSEYEALLQATDKRAAVEAFWIKITGSKERARMLIRYFYSRVAYANKYFTSYKEGWKTDRGMLSIVMGPPNTITRSNKGETWIYGTSNNMIMSLMFSFDKRNGTFVDEDFQLDRYRNYKDYWYRAVETWRQGRVYTFN